MEFSHCSAGLLQVPLHLKNSEPLRDSTNLMLLPSDSVTSNLIAVFYMTSSKCHKLVVELSINSLKFKSMSINKTILCILLMVFTSIFGFGQNESGLSENVKNANDLSIETEPQGQIQYLSSYGDVFWGSFKNFINYTWNEITCTVNPWYVNYFWLLVLLSVVVWGLEIIFPWRKKSTDCKERLLVRCIFYVL